MRSSSKSSSSSGSIMSILRIRSIRSMTSSRSIISTRISRNWSSIRSISSIRETETEEQVHEWADAETFVIHDGAIGSGRTWGRESGWRSVKLSKEFGC